MCNVHVLPKIGFSKKLTGSPQDFRTICKCLSLLARQKAADVRGSLLAAARSYFKCLLDVQILSLLQGHMRLCVLQAAAAAAERRARDDAGCACGAKGGTSFTKAEVIELESQLSSAAPCQQKVTRESDAQQPGDAEHQSAIGSRAHAQNGTGSEAISQQQSVQVGLQSGFADRHVHQQRGGTVEQKQSEHQQDNLIDLTADSDHEAEVID